MTYTKTRPALVALVQDLRKRSWEHEAPIWRDIATRLEKPTRRHAAINVSRIDRYVNVGETALVPGKVLAAGDLTKKVDVAALAFSEGARTKIEKAGGKCWTVAELAQANPKGKNVRILG
ncbi:MAG TPA: 50S ribosomal protein L18e [Candidatus Thermoplasmatota archaeon]|nr:50S ribosomal protein L18e [Candidatus Thermoplasmatota archaeon]